MCRRSSAADADSAGADGAGGSPAALHVTIALTDLQQGTGARAHHVLHWLDHGATDLDNAALLCERHHQTVHRRRLWATVRKRPDDRGRYVVWDLTDGSYDQHLHQLARERAAHDPPLMTPARLRELTAALTDDDSRGGRWADADRRLAEHDLSLWSEHTDDTSEEDLEDARALWREPSRAA